MAAHWLATLSRSLRSGGIVIVLCFGISGCAAFEADFSQPGGAVGYYAGKIMPAPTKQLELYRAVVAFALFSRMGADLAGNSDNAVALYRYMVATRNDLNVLAARLYTTKCPALDKICTIYPQTFEDELPTLEGHLYKLAVAGLSSLDAKSVINDLSSGDYLGALIALSKIGGATLSAGHQVAADYRSEREVFGYVVATSLSPPLTPPPDVATALVIIRSNAPVNQPILYKKFLSGISSPDTGVFDALYSLVRDSCEILQGKLLPSDVSATGVKCVDFKMDPTLVAGYQ
jgi:hypothetical protein